MLVLEGFSGAGGASLGIHRALPDATVIGIEMDRDACRTRAAAGLLTIRADIAQMATEPFVDKVGGAWFSPPCPSFSNGGQRAGVHVMDLLLEAMRATIAGHDVRTETRERCEASLRPEHGPKAERFAAMSVLVLEPARWAHDLRPGWIACEQVPAVLPLWRTLGHGLETLGYGWWCGLLDPANYGVAQNRPRAILMAKAGAEVKPPAPTHSDHRKGGSLFGLEPWQSMADRLGWGMTDRPALTVAFGCEGGGPDSAGVGGSGARRTLERERERRVGWRVKTRGEAREQDTFNADRPSRAITGKSDSWRRT